MITATSSTPPSTASLGLFERLRDLPPKKRLLFAVRNPLSFSQQRLWFIERLTPKDPSYNLPFAIGLRGRVNIPALEQALCSIVERHGILRTRFGMLEGRPLQLVDPAVVVSLAMIDLSGYPANLKESAAQVITRAEATRPFNLERGPLFRAAMVVLEPRRFLLLLSMHHIVADGWSLGIMITELAALYRSYTGKMARIPPQPPIQYLDYARWQRKWLRGEELERQLNFWKQQLDGAPPLLALPMDRPRPNMPTNRGARVYRFLPSELGKAYYHLCASEGLTGFMAIVVLVTILLARYSRQSDISLGTPVANRERGGAKDLIGCFVNTLVMRNQLADNPDLRQLMARVRATALAAYSHQDLPFEKLVESLQPPRQLGVTPLFQVMLSTESTAAVNLELEDFQLQPLEPEVTSTKFDLSIVVAENEEGWYWGIDYNRDIFDAPRIDRMIDHIANLAREIVRDPKQRFSRIPLMDLDEREALLANTHSRHQPWPECRLGELLRARAERHPQRTALIWEDREFSYSQLDAASNAMAHLLAERGVGPGSVVAVMMAPSPTRLLAVFGILKAGAAYLPLEPNYPDQRLNLMMNEASARLMLTHKHMDERLPRPALDRLSLSLDWDSDTRALLANYDQGPPEIKPHPEDTAYVIYTSGSTGRPKGVVVSHRAIGVRFLAEPDPMENVRILTTATFGFDLSVWENLGSIAKGLTVVIAPAQAQGDPMTLMHLIQRHRVDLIHLIPSLLRLAMEGDATPLRGLRRIITGGEVLPLDLHNRVIQELGIPFYNAYGPTEAAFSCTAHICDRPQEQGTIPIGKPHANTRVFILDGELEPVPKQVPGELFIAGHSLARGYLGQPALTAAAFLPCPFAEVPGERMYRSGDLTHFLLDGSIAFMGRVDNQVKIFGQRIEPGESANLLRTHPAVREALVTARRDNTGETRLVGYVTLNAPGEGRPAATTGELETFLAEKMPVYMVPSNLVILDDLPLLANGKLDYGSLPDPERAPSNSAYEAPTSKHEIIVAEVWSTVLARDRVGRNDNFYDLGGHSLLAVRVQLALTAKLGRDVALVRLFEFPTVAKLAAFLEEEGAIGETEAPEVNEKWAENRRRALVRQRGRRRVR